MVYNGVQWCTMVHNGAQWCTMVYNGVQWCTMVYNGVLSIILFHDKCDLGGAEIQSGSIRFNRAFMFKLAFLQLPEPLLAHDAD